MLTAQSGGQSPAWPVAALRAIGSHPSTCWQGLDCAHTSAPASYARKCDRTRRAVLFATVRHASSHPPQRSQTGDASWRQSAQIGPAADPTPILSVFTESRGAVLRFPGVVRGPECSTPEFGGCSPTSDPAPCGVAQCPVLSSENAGHSTTHHGYPESRITFGAFHAPLSLFSGPPSYPGAARFLRHLCPLVQLPAGIGVSPPAPI